MRACNSCRSMRSAPRPMRETPIFRAGCGSAEIRRWHTDGRSPLRASVEMQLVRIDDGAVNWQRQFLKTVPVVGAARLDELSADAVKEVLREVFGS